MIFFGFGSQFDSEWHVFPTETISRELENAFEIKNCTKNRGKLLSKWNTEMIEVSLSSRENMCRLETDF